MEGETKTETEFPMVRYYWMTQMLMVSVTLLGNLLGRPTLMENLVVRAPMGDLMVWAKPMVSS